MVYDAIDNCIKLRYHFMPYIYSLAGAVHFDDYTILRSLLFDFPQDKEARKIENQFMFGPSLLICAVTEPMYYEVGSKEIEHDKKWTCYLPEGCGWYDYWTNKYYEGGQYVTVDAPIDVMPIFVKAGSIIPTAEGLQYAAQKPEQPMKVYVYPGADAAFKLYEDEGDNYNFEKGAYATTEFIWDDKAKELKVGERKGSFEGMEELKYVVEVK